MIVFHAVEVGSAAAGPIYSFCRDCLLACRTTRPTFEHKHKMLDMQNVSMFDIHLITVLQSVAVIQQTLLVGRI